MTKEKQTIHDTEGGLIVQRRWQDVIYGVDASSYHKNKSIEAYEGLLKLELKKDFPKMEIEVDVCQENWVKMSKGNIQVIYPIETHEEIINECIEHVEADAKFWIKKGGK